MTETSQTREAVRQRLHDVAMMSATIGPRDAIAEAYRDTGADFAVDALGLLAALSEAEERASVLQQAVLERTAERDTALARIAGMGAGETWLTEQEVDEVGKLRFDLAMKVYRMSAALKATPSAALARAEVLLRPKGSTMPIGFIYAKPGSQADTHPIYVITDPDIVAGTILDLAAAISPAPTVPPVECLARAERTKLTADDVVWITNDNAELGVKIGNQFFFLYKGSSLVYDPPEHDDGTPMHWRTVGKREFGECCHPINHQDYSKIGTVSLDDSDRWLPMAPAPTVKGEG